VAEKIRALENFGALEFIPKEKTRVSMSEFKNDVAISGENPFPDAFRVTPAKTGAADVENLASEIRRIKGVEEVRYDRGLVALTQTLDEAGSFAGYVIKIIAVALMALLIMAALPVFKTGRVFAGQAFRDSLPAAAGRFDFFRLLWTGGGGLAALAAFETLRRLAAADVTSGIRTADAILALAGGMVFSAASAMLFPAKEEHGENE
jgi:tetrahydromethanopterin S-methyltransferase subunit F